MLGPMLTYPRRFAGRRVVHFVDNTVALSAFVHSYVGKEDLAPLLNVFHTTAAALRAQTYLDWVPSKANMADLPSRGEFGIPRAMGAEVTTMRLPTYAELAGPLEAWFDRASDAVPPGARLPV